MNQRSKTAVQFVTELMKAKFSRGDPYRINRLVFNNFRQLGGVYVKFLQMLAMSTDFLQGWAGPREMEVFDEVERETIDVEATLRREIPDRLNYFSNIETTPFATGSFAQVYRARLVDGRNVIIKILRPLVAENLDQDLKNIGRIVNILSRIMPASAYDMRASYREFAFVTALETDYNRECANAQWFTNYFSTKPDVVIPQSFPELSTKTVLTQEFITGMTLAEAMRAQQNGQDIKQLIADQTGSDIWRQMETLGNEILLSAFKADYIIGDPHPGNIILLPDNKIGLIDFGLVAKAPTNRHAFLAFMREYQRFYNGDIDIGDFALAALAFYDDRLSQMFHIAGNAVMGNEFRDQLKTAINNIFETHASEDRVQGFMRRRQMTQLFDKVINAGNRFGLYVDPANLTVLKAAITYMQVIGLIAEHDNSTQNFDILQRIFTYVVETADKTGVAKSPSGKALSTDTATQLFADWISSVADRDPFLYQNLTGRIEA